MFVCLFVFSLLVFTVFLFRMVYKKSFILISVPLPTKCLFSLYHYIFGRVFSFSLILSSWLWWVLVYCPPPPRLPLPSSSWLIVLVCRLKVFIMFQKIGGILPSNIFFCSFFSLRDSNYMCIRPLIFQQWSLKMCCFFHLSSILSSSIGRWSSLLEVFCNGVSVVYHDHWVFHLKHWIFNLDFGLFCNFSVSAYNA